MNKLYTAFLGILMTATALQAQSRQFAFFEHFTQASCGPCATQNPAFQDEILANNYGNMHHIAYHTSWPGTDPMNADNPEPVQTRVTYYGVTGVPSMIMNGVDMGGPASIVQNNVDNLNAEPAPIKVKVTETGTDMRSVTIEIETTENHDLSNLVLQTAIVEREVIYSSPPGNNGETYFPNVFRETLNEGGTPITLAEMGNSLSFDYTYSLDESWNPEDVYVIAYVQNNTNKSVINSGSSNDPTWAHYTSESRFKEALEDNVSFTGNLITVNGGGDFTVNLVSNQPASWVSSITAAGNSSINSLAISAGANETLDIALDVTPSNEPAVGEYIITVSSVNGDFAPQTVRYFVSSNIWDLVVFNEAGFGDGADYGDLSPLYSDGLDAADNKYNATVGHSTFINGLQSGAFSKLKNIYFNVGWSFPSLTDEKVAAFQSFLDNGGNMLIAGQDIAWERTDAGYSTPATDNFFENYMHAEYVDDGGTTNATLVANTADVYFGWLFNTNIDNFYGTNYYPDQINVVNGGTPIFYYNNDPSLVAGVRFEGDYKMVYSCIGIEMMEDDNFRNNFMKAVHDYFYAGSEDDPTVPPPAVGIQAITADWAIDISPNPATTFVDVDLSDVQENTTVRIFDVTGKLVLTQKAAASAQTLRLSVQNLANGAYLLQVMNAKGAQQTQQLQLIR